jgi:energy-coupling factor transporter ATP-binding protein EcfA2
MLIDESPPPLRRKPAQAPAAQPPLGATRTAATTPITSRDQPRGPGSPVQIRELRSTGAGLQIEDFGGEISSALGGIMKNACLLVGGDPGAGKSTLSAELSALVARKRRSPLYWLDQDQRGEEDTTLIYENFRRVGIDPAGLVHLVGGRSLNDPDYARITWRDALGVVPHSAPVIVLDSLQKWAHGDADRAALLDHVARLPMLAIVIVRNNAEGNIGGRVDLQYEGDATINIHKDHFEIPKCRWLRGCPQNVDRIARDAGAPSDVIIH